MGWPVCNTTEEDMRLSETVVWHGYTFHELGLGLSAIFSAIAIVVSFFLIGMHATHYLRPNEQRHIVRILLMVPVYAAVSLLSFYYYWHSVYFEVLRDCYEAFAIASFFSLMCAYIEEDLHRQKHYFRAIQPKPWVWPMRWVQKCFGGDKGCLRTPRSGLTWFNVIWVAVFQYCFIRVAMTIVAVVTQMYDRYCLESLNPAFSHVWVMCIEALAVSIAMYCLIQFYVQVKTDIAQHNPLQKVIAIKLVIFLSFWQTIVISFLTSSGALKASDEFQSPDIKVGIPAMLLCIEMALFSVFHIFAFSWRPYVIGSKSYQNEIAADSKPTPQHYQGGYLGTRAIIDAFNVWDLVKAIGRSARWLFIGRKKRHTDSSYTATQLTSNSVRGNEAALGSSNIRKTSTSYKPHGEVATLADEGQTLLSAPAPMPNGSTPQRHQPELSPYHNNAVGYFEAGDIGIAQSTSDNSSYHMPPTSTPHNPEQRPYDIQETGTVSISNVRYEPSRSTDLR